MCCRCRACRQGRHFFSRRSHFPLFLFPFTLPTDVLQENITRVLVPAVNSTHRGRYQCVASNKEGTSRSNDVQLDVLCKYAKW